MTWTSATENIDSLIRDYLLQRGFNITLKSFDNDLKNDKEKGFKADKILQHFLAYVHAHDIDSLRSYWNHLDSRVFCRFEQSQLNTVKKMEYNLYKFYLINCVQSGKRKECLEFFEKFSQELNNLPEWKDWFTFPFLQQPESNKLFATYFTKTWSDTFLVSLQNFFAVTFACLPAPHLCDAIHQDKMKIEQYENEIEALKQKLSDAKEISIPQSSPANYVRSLGIPGSLSENEPVAIQSQKKKTFSSVFSTKKTTPPTSKTKTAPKVSAKAPEPSSASAESTSAMSAVQEGSQKSKKLSGYHLQRKELLGSSSLTPKHKSLSKDEVPASPVHHTSATATTTPMFPTISSSPELHRAAGSPSVSQVTASTIATNQHVTSPSTVTHQMASSPVFSHGVSSSPTAMRHPVVDQTTAVNHDSTFSPINMTSEHSSGADNLASSPVELDFSSKENNTVGTIDDRPRHSLIVLSKDEYQEHHSAIIQARFNRSGETVASCDKDGIVKIWKYEPNLSTVATVMSRSPFLSLEWCKIPNLLLLGSSSRTLRLYDTAAKQSLQDVSLSLAYPQVLQIACAPSGETFATSCSRHSNVTEMYMKGPDSLQNSAGRIELWKFTPSRVEASNILHEAKNCGVPCLAFNSNGDTLVCGDTSGGITLFDVRSGKSLCNKSAHTGQVHTIELVDNHLFTLGADGKFLAWDLSNMDQPITFPVHSSVAGPFEVSGYSGYRQVHCPNGGKLFSFEPDGHHLLTCDGNSTLMYSVELAQASLKKELVSVGHKSPVVSVDWSAALNCGHCLSGSMDGKLHIVTLLNQ